MRRLWQARCQRIEAVQAGTARLRSEAGRMLQQLLPGCGDESDAGYRQLLDKGQGSNHSLSPIARSLPVRLPGCFRQMTNPDLLSSGCTSVFPIWIAGSKIFRRV